MRWWYLPLLFAAILTGATVTYLVLSAGTVGSEQATEPCTEADSACIGWSELHYPGIEWRTD